MIALFAHYIYFTAWSKLKFGRAKRQKRGVPFCCCFSLLLFAVAWPTLKSLSHLFSPFTKVLRSFWKLSINFPTSCKEWTWSRKRKTTLEIFFIHKNLRCIYGLWLLIKWYAQLEIVLVLVLMQIYLQYIYMQMCGMW